MSTTGDLRFFTAVKIPQQLLWASSVVSDSHVSSVNSLKHDAFWL